MEEKRSSVSLCEKQNMTIHFAAFELNNRGKIEVKKSWAEITGFGPKLFNLNKVLNSIELLETFALRNSSSTQHKTCSYVS
jgi:hypothetical protein